MGRPVTLITGTRKGIGRHLAEHYLGKGHVVVGCSRGEGTLVADAYRHVRMDVTDEAAVRALFKMIRDEWGHLDHLVNNAGVASMNHALLTPTAVVRHILDVNLVGTFVLSREAAKLMKRAGYGRIVNFTTVAVPLRLAGEAAYVASKAAVESLTHVLARELADFGITVNAVGPAPVETDLVRGVPREKLEALLERQAIARFASCEDVANVVDFFLRRESDLVTGQTLYLGGV